MDPVVLAQLGTAHPLARHLGDFLTDLGNANSSAQTIRAYRGDLFHFAAHHDGEIGELDAAPVRAYLAEIGELAPSTRKRKRAAVASFCRWAVRHDLLMANPMDKIDTIKVPETLPRPAAAADVAKVLAGICSRRPRKDVPLRGRTGPPRRVRRGSRLLPLANSQVSGPVVPCLRQGCPRAGRGWGIGRLAESGCANVATSGPGESGAAAAPAWPAARRRRARR